MSWIAKPFPLIPGYDSLGDMPAAKFWVGQTLEKWLDRADPVPQFASELKTRADVCRFMIEQFEYPMVRGMPNDKHTMNWFSGLECYTITLDYWQLGSETLRTLLLSQKADPADKGMGDCEDTSMAFVTLFLEKGWKAVECLGSVYDDTGYLGGHGWSLFQDEEGPWRLYESTLDEAPLYPAGYPIANVGDNDWRVGSLIYHADAKFDRADYFEWDFPPPPRGYLYISFRAKETRRKYQAIEKAWGVRTKPIRKAGLMGAIRWRR